MSRPIFKTVILFTLITLIGACGSAATDLSPTATAVPPPPTLECTGSTALQASTEAYAQPKRDLTSCQDSGKVKVEAAFPATSKAISSAM